MGGDCKLVLHWARHLVVDGHVRPRTLHQGQRDGCITHLDDFVVGVQAFGAILTPTEAIVAKSYGWAFLKAPQELHENTNGRDRCLRPHIHANYHVI